MGAALISENVATSSEVVEEQSEDLETLYKLLNLEKDLLKLKGVIEDVKKVKKSCSVSLELQEMNASRKK